MGYTLYPWQEECLDVWFMHNTRGCVNAVTGSGKTVLAMFAVKELESRCIKPLKVKVIVPTIAILNQWLRTFRAFFSEKEPDSYDRMQTGCWYGDSKRDCKYMVYVVNSARDVLKRHILKDIENGYEVLLVADEYHHYRSPENIKIFSFLPLKDMSAYHSLGLSATPAGNLEPLGDEIYRYGFKQALKQGRISGFSILQVELRFTADELELYDEYTKQMIALIVRLKKKYPYLKNVESGAFFAALRHLASEAGGEDELAMSYLNYMYLRRGVALTARARTECLLTLLPLLDDDSRILIFCERIEQAETVYRSLLPKYQGMVGRYHSGLDKNANRNALRAFREHETRILISCRALDEGVDVPDANIGVVLSGTSTQRQRIQRLGRILRVSDEKAKAALYYFYVKESAEESAYFSETEKLGPVCSLSFDLSDDSFIHNEYEAAALKVLNDISSKTEDKEKIKEARRCLMEGIALPDWLNTHEYCDCRMEASGDVHRKNYWLCMKKMSEVNELGIRS